MISDIDLQEIAPRGRTSSASATHVVSGIPLPKPLRVRSFSPDEWEEFVEEWASSLESEYAKVRRFGGSGDLGVDIAGICSQDGFKGPWDNYQCKRYDHPLRPSDIWVEIGKIIYYSFKGKYIPPRKHYFVGSQDIGTTLEQLLNDPAELQFKTEDNWEKYCKTGITSTMETRLSGELFDYFHKFDFTIFSSKSIVELINDHSYTHYHAVRFGGGLPFRPDSLKPPAIPSGTESRYIRQILDAYAHHLSTKICNEADLEPFSALKRDYLRQRERFYHAESLRNFSRDTVPEGTFSALQDEIFYGVVDVCEDNHADGFARMKATITHSSSIAASANPLASAFKTQDRQGICHQLANDDRLTWVPENE
ncbi:hypothetical protein C4J93_4738 [Pseudomonas sp. R2-37-08W]|uniref:ABC-three component system protein n=1 Tax=unclassified Pseudomonas TaxID=196821 RepID=UPI000F58CAB1|nr:MULTISPECIES: ABC-three component system protein [unclassified Pseudomonas]AZF12898.1 hypothetical protein C4J93_4738 [Pseudomonas sp. R2-37-08W]AZF28881.1 hypothetical protein C4J90_4746 [Pseudomonas sp. R2-60-08W]